MNFGITLKKRNKLWIWVAICRKTKQILAIFCGKRTKKAARSIWSLIKDLRPRTIVTDKWSAYRGILPKRKHVVGKQYTQAIESVNATFRHYLCRFRRKTKGYSKCKYMVESTLALFTFKKSIFS